MQGRSNSVRQMSSSTDYPPPESLDPGLLRLVEGIALTLARKHHALEMSTKALPQSAEIGSDGLPFPLRPDP
jgi:hypothetical protein